VPIADRALWAAPSALPRQSPPLPAATNSKSKHVNGQLSIGHHFFLRSSSDSKWAGMTASEKEREQQMAKITKSKRKAKPARGAKLQKTAVKRASSRRRKTASPRARRKAPARRKAA
jgi:hypothetical protein